MPDQRTNHSYAGFGVGDRVAYEADGVQETAVVTELTDPKVGVATGSVYDLKVRVLTSTDARAVGKTFHAASADCRKV